jgi:hypothetical protein
MNPPGLPHVECGDLGFDGFLIVQVLRGVLLGKKGDWTKITRRYLTNKGRDDVDADDVEAVWNDLVADLRGMGWGVPADMGFEGADDDKNEPDPELSD